MVSGWKREDVIRYGAALVIVFLVVTNFWLMVRVSYLVERVNNIPTHIPSSNTYVNLSPIYTGVVNSHIEMVSTEVSETLNVKVLFTLTERIPGYEVLVRYRERDTDIWDEVRPTVVDGLRFEAIVPIGLGHNYEYQIIQVQNGQIMRATTAGHINVGDWVGSPNLRIGRGGYPNERKVQVSFHQPQPSRIRAWQVDKVTIKLDNMTDEIVLEMFAGQWVSHKFDEKVYQAAKEITVTAYYGDGETRSITFDPNNYMPPEPIIKRD